jgi:hypothetical protein
VEQEQMPRVTPYLLRRAERMCPLRLRRDFLGQGGLRSQFLRFRVRDPLLEAARATHADMQPARAEHFRAPPELRGEERAVFERAAGIYVRQFGAEPARALDHGCDRPTPWPSRGIRVGGSIDLTVEDAEGTRELRQLELWRRVPPDPPLDAVDIRLAVLRLARWAGGERLRVRWCDLVGDDVRTQEVDLQAEVPRLKAWLDDRIRVVQERAAEPIPEPGVDCGTCAHVPACPVHR